MPHPRQTPRRPLHAQAARRAICLLVAGLPLIGCRVLDRGFLLPGGPIAAATSAEFLRVCVVMLFVVIPVLLLTPLIAWYYRLSNTKAVYQPQWGFNWVLEGLIWVPPTLIVIGLAVFLWRDTLRLDPYRRLPGQSLDVQVIAADWKWIFIYPEQGIATVDRLVIAAGRPVRLSLTSATVMQSILIPRLAGQIYAMPGMRTELNFAADAPGTFLGQNAQFNGIGFQNQHFDVVALDADGFARWLAQMRAQPNRLDDAAYRRLTGRSILPHPLGFGAVEPGLFDRVAGQRAPDGRDAPPGGRPSGPMPMGRHAFKYAAAP